MSDRPCQTATCEEGTERLGRRWIRISGFLFTAACLSPYAINLFARIKDCVPADLLTLPRDVPLFNLRSSFHLIGSCGKQQRFPFCAVSTASLGCVLKLKVCQHFSLTLMTEISSVMILGQMSRKMRSALSQICSCNLCLGSPPTL